MLASRNDGFRTVRNAVSVLLVVAAIAVTVGRGRVDKEQPSPPYAVMDESGKPAAALFSNVTARAPSQRGLAGEGSLSCKLLNWKGPVVHAANCSPAGCSGEYLWLIGYEDCAPACFGVFPAFFYEPGLAGPHDGKQKTGAYRCLFACEVCEEQSCYSS